jgi:hypothetical protein
MPGICSAGANAPTNNCSGAVSDAIRLIDPRIPSFLDDMLTRSTSTAAPAASATTTTTPTYAKEKALFKSKSKILLDLEQTNASLSGTCGGAETQAKAAESASLLQGVKRKMNSVENNINMNKRKSFYEHQETSSQINIIRYLFFLYWIVLIIYIGIIMTVAYNPARKNIIRISILTFLAFPLLMNRLVPIVGGWFFDFWNSLPKNIYTEL